LQRVFLRTVRGFFESLKNTLAQRCSKVVFLTVPLVPRLLGHKPESSRWLKRINTLIESWHNGSTVIVVPIDGLFCLPGGKPDLSLRKVRMNYSRFNNIVCGLGVTIIFLKKV